ncbi:MAG: NUDIX hydrolase [Trueperaceae bacterium]|nr:NUDIX hydrolase [Trueperaceae bacterium]
MDYIKTIRSLVGHYPLILISAMVLIINDKNELLFQERMSTGAWHLPGGFMEPGEKIEATAIREAKEETGLDVHDLSLFGVFSGPEFHWTYPNGDEVYNVTVAFICRNFTGELSADGEEGKSVKFISLNGIPDKLGPPAKPVLEQFLQSSFSKGLSL